MSEYLDLIKSQKYFYRNSYHRACMALWGALIIIIVLSFLILYVYLTRPASVYYASSEDGTLTRITPLNSPNYSNTPLIQ